MYYVNLKHKHKSVTWRAIGSKVRDDELIKMEMADDPAGKKHTDTERVHFFHNGHHIYLICQSRSTWVWQQFQHWNSFSTAVQTSGEKERRG